MKILNLIAIILVIIGAINWGLVGLMGLDLVDMLVGSMPMVAQAVYVLVGLAGVYTIFLAKKMV